MIIKNVNLETVCGITSAIPDNLLDEVAFAGKSNVGKSSLINALMNRKSLARTSSQPGKTQTINFYNVNEAMYLVDLPGYGYANANIEIKAKWGQMIENYLHISKRLKAVFLLIDIRHEPSENDQMMYEWMVHRSGICANHHCNKIGQIKKDANPATCANDKGYPASRAWNDRYSVFCGVKTGPGRNLADCRIRY